MSEEAVVFYSSTHRHTYAHARVRVYECVWGGGGLRVCVCSYEKMGIACALLFSVLPNQKNFVVLENIEILGKTISK